MKQCAKESARRSEPIHRQHDRCCDVNGMDCRVINDVEQFAVFLYCVTFEAFCCSPEKSLFNSCFNDFHTFWFLLVNNCVAVRGRTACEIIACSVAGLPPQFAAPFERIATSARLDFKERCRPLRRCLSVWLRRNPKEGRRKVWNFSGIAARVVKLCIINTAPAHVFLIRQIGIAAAIERVSVNRRHLTAQRRRHWRDISLL